jgi:hypothetical protein
LSVTVVNVSSPATLLCYPAQGGSIRLMNTGQAPCWVGCSASVSSTAGLLLPPGGHTQLPQFWNYSTGAVYGVTTTGLPAFTTVSVTVSVT